MKKLLLYQKLLALSFILLFSVLGHGQNFSSGNIVVSKVGDGTTTIASAGVSLPVQLIEYEPYAENPVALKTVALNSGTGTKLTLGNLNGEGQLKLSLDGRYITLLGYDSAPLANTTTHRATSSTVGRIGYDGTTNLYSFTPTSTAGSVRSAVSIDGSTFFTKSTRPDNVLNVNTTPTATPVTTFANFSVRTLELFNNVLFTGEGSHLLKFSSQVTSNTTSGLIATDIVPMDNGTRGGVSNLCGFVLLDSDNSSWNNTGLDLLYIADQSGGIYKYSFDGSNFKWISTYYVNSGSTPSNITGRINSAGKVELFYTSGNGTASNNNLIMLTDSNAKNLAINATVKVIATAGANFGFRGVAFSPNYTKTWTGTTSTDYSTGSNWADGTAPLSTDFIEIPTGLSRYPIISANTTIAAGAIAAGATLTVNEGIVLNVTSSITNNGDLILKSSTIGTASLTSPTSVANVTQQRYLTSNQRGWRLISNPLSSTTFGTLALNSTTPITLGANASGVYDSESNTWSSTDNSATMASKQAYKVFIRGGTSEVTAADYGSVTTPANVTLAIKGTATNTVPAAITTTATQWYLVANPYSASVSVARILTASTGLSSSVAYYDPAQGGTDAKIKAGGYAAITIPNGAVVGSADDIVLPPLGAIFVQADSNGTINIPKTVIYTGSVTPRSNGQLFTNKTVQSIAPTSLSGSIKIAVTSANVKYDNLHLQFNEAGVKSNIAFGKLPNTFLDLYSISKDQRKMAVAELELVDQTIPLGLTSTQLKNFSFNVVENSIPDGFEAVLVDKLTNNTKVLSTGTNYNFYIDSTPASQGNKRFEINLKTKTTITAIENKLDPNLKIWPIPATNEFNITNNQAQNEGNSEISISNLSGQSMHTHQSSPGTTTTIRTNGWTPGIYILNATKNGKQTTTKLIIQ